MMQKIINKIFFKKVFFRIFVVLNFFLGLICFLHLCSNYNNPYNYYISKKYNNIIEFVDDHIAPYHLYPKYYVDFDYHRYLYENAYKAQAASKGIIRGTAFTNESFAYHIYSCDKNKFEQFKTEYKKRKGIGFEPWLPEDENFVVDCSKAKNIALAPESYYFIKHRLFLFILMSFAVVPFGILLIWLAIRFIIISPILWVFKKD